MEGKEVVEKVLGRAPKPESLAGTTTKSLALILKVNRVEGGTSSQLPSLFSLLQVKGLVMAECGQERGKEGASMGTLMFQYK